MFYAILSCYVRTADSIVISSFLVLLLEKTRLPDVYAWFLSPGLLNERLRGVNRPREIAGKTENIISDGTKLFGSSKDTEKEEES